MQTATWGRPPTARVLAGVFALSLLAVAAYLAVGTLSRDVAMPVAFIVAVALGAGALGQGTRWHRAYRALFAFLAVAGLALPLLLNAFAHLSEARYLWVIAQPGLCSHMGSAAAIVTSAALGVCVGFGSIGLLIATRQPGDAALSSRSIYTAAFIVALIGLLVIARPDVVALLLQCG